MDAQDDGLHDDEEHGDAGGGAARGGSCLNMNPMRMALPVAGGAPRAQRTWWSATAEHVAAATISHPCVMEPMLR